MRACKCTLGTGTGTASEGSSNPPPCTVASVDTGPQHQASVISCTGPHQRGDESMCVCDDGRRIGSSWVIEKEGGKELERERNQLITEGSWSRTKGVIVWRGRLEEDKFRRNKAHTLGHAVRYLLHIAAHGGIPCRRSHMAHTQLCEAGFWSTERIALIYSHA